MIKLSNKGFAVSTILYGVLSLTILILMLIFGVMKSSKDMNSSLVESLTNSMNNCVSLEVKLENCYLGGGSCMSESEEFRNCVMGSNSDQTPAFPNNGTKLRDKILGDNTEHADNVRSPYVNSDIGINFGASSSDTNGKGLYYTSTNTENNQITYYFRGEVDNNYVKFGQDSNGNDILWRIIRINEDGSVRLITQDIIGTSKYNENYADNAYVGYMYGAIRQSGSNAYNLTHENNKPSTIKNYLDQWYVNNLNSYTDFLSGDSGFCNDRSVAPSAGLWYMSDTALGYDKKFTIYGSAGRLVSYSNIYEVKENAQPQFKCPNETRDLFTITSSIKGNKKLINPIGLITMDEVAYAGGVFGGRSQNMYLSGSYTWTMSPFSYRSSSADVWGLNDYGGAEAYVVEGYWFDDEVIHEDSVRPVINLKSTVELSSELPSGCTEQKGTQACPYIVDTSV